MFEIDVIDGDFIRELLAEIKANNPEREELISALNIHENSKGMYDISCVLTIRCRRIFGIDLPDKAEWPEFVNELAKQRNEDWKTCFVFLLEYILKVKTA